MGPGKSLAQGGRQPGGSRPGADPEPSLRIGGLAGRRTLGRLALAGILLLLVWISFFPRPVINGHPLVTRIGLALACLAVLLERRQRVFRWTDWPIWLFALSLLPSVFAAQLDPLAVRLYLDLALPALLVYYLVSEILAESQAFRLAALALCVMSALVSLGGLADFLFSENPVYRHLLENPYYRGYIAGVARPMSSQYNPAALGGYLLASLPFHVLLFREARSRRAQWLAAAGVALLALVLILTFSRGAFLGLVAAYLFYLHIHDRRLKAIVYGTLLCLFVAAASIPGSPFQRLGFRSLGRMGVVSQYRTNRADIAWRMFRDHPLAGVGLEQYRVHFEEYDLEEEYTPRENRIADNMYLTLLAETGLAGTLGFALLAGSLIQRAGRRLRRSSRPPPGELRLIICLMAFIGLLVDMAGYELFFWPNQYLHLLFIVGCLSALFKQGVGRDRGEASSPAP